MGKDNHGEQCRGEWPSKKPCRRRRDGSGKPCWLNRACDNCGEYRCKKHCRCGRRGEGKYKLSDGHPSAASPSSSSATASSSSAALSLAPVGRAPAPSCRLLADAREMYSMVCTEIEGSSEVELASYQYDNPTLHAALLKRLNGRRKFTLNVYIDTEQFGGRVPKMMKSRIRELGQSGASVYLCKGGGPRGSFHAKGLVIDRRYLYCGSPNLTGKSVNNEEWPMRCTGDVVGQVLSRLAIARVRWPLWDGL